MGRRSPLSSTSKSAARSVVIMRPRLSCTTTLIGTTSTDDLNVTADWPDTPARPSAQNAAMAAARKVFRKKVLRMRAHASVGHRAVGEQLESCASMSGEAKRIADLDG